MNNGIDLKIGGAGDEGKRSTLAHIINLLYSLHND